MNENLGLDKLEKLVARVLVKALLTGGHGFFGIAFIQKVIDDLRDFVGAEVADLVVGQIEHVLIVCAAFFLLHYRIEESDDRKMCVKTYFEALSDTVRLNTIFSGVVSLSMQK